MADPFRIFLVVVALLATAGLGYRAVDDEARLSSARQQGAMLDQAAEEAVAALLDIRGSLHAYVAPGPGAEFWSKRAAAQLDTLRQRLATSMRRSPPPADRWPIRSTLLISCRRRQAGAPIMPTAASSC